LIGVLILVKKLKLVKRFFGKLTKIKQKRKL